MVVTLGLTGEGYWPWREARASGWGGGGEVERVEERGWRGWRGVEEVKVEGVGGWGWAWGGRVGGGERKQGV